MKLVMVFIVGGLIEMWLVLTGRPFSLIFLYLGIVIPGWLILQYFPGGVFPPNFFEKIHDFIKKIGVRFFPNKTQKPEEQVLNDIEQSDSLLAEMSRRYQECMTDFIKRYSERKDDTSGGAE